MVFTFPSPVNHAFCTILYEKSSSDGVPVVVEEVRWGLGEVLGVVVAGGWGLGCGSRVAFSFATRKHTLGWAPAWIEPKL